MQARERQVGGRRDVFLSLGSNLGDRECHLRSAVAALPDVEAVSAIYETSPVGGPGGQGPYLNMVVKLRTALPPQRLLALCRELEEAAGRVRAERNGPRTLDVDILLIGSEAIDTADLVVPHPRMLQRRFVLVPLQELAPALVSGEAVRQAAGQVWLWARSAEAGAEVDVAKPSWE